jgi:hypothetical protein
MAISDHPMPFGEVLEAVDRLTPEEQEALAAMIHRRLAERGRKQLAEEIRGRVRSSRRAAADRQRWTN